MWTGAGIESGAVTSVSRRSATADGQRHDVPLRSRDLSGIRSRGNSPLVYARNLLELRELIASVGPRVLGVRTDGRRVVDGFDGFRRWSLPFTLVVLRDRSVNRIGHVVHRSRDITRLDITEVDGVPTMSADPNHHRSGWVRRLPNGWRRRSIVRCGDGLTSERFPAPAESLSCGVAVAPDSPTLVSVLEGNEITRGDTRGSSVGSLCAGVASRPAPSADPGDRRQAQSVG